MDRSLTGVDIQAEGLFHDLCRDGEIHPADEVLFLFLPGGALSSCSERKYVSEAASRFLGQGKGEKGQDQKLYHDDDRRFCYMERFHGIHSPPGICGAEFPALMQNGRERPADIIWGQAGEYAGCQEK